MENFLKYYKISSITAVLAVVIGGFIGYSSGGGLGAMAASILSIVVLCVLEISLSFDNAVVNAKKLKDMDQYWREWFIKWGILIAVFGMRLVFPVLIVSILGQITPWDAMYLAINNPEQYAHVLEESHYIISAFGGTFLLMVALEFFLDEDKELHWLHPIENGLAIIGKPGIILDIFISMAVVVAISFEIEEAHQMNFIIAGAVGVGLFLALQLLKAYLEKIDEDSTKANVAKASGAVAKSGLAGVIYLEVVDASMSFDGVIGAFAITTNIFIVLLGLGVGAFFVRSMTIHLVEKETLSEFRYLEHGAFWAILFLAMIMLFGPVLHISEVITGCIGATFITAAVVHSYRLNKKDKYLEAQEAKESQELK